MVIFLNIIPNVYWVYNSINDNKTYNDYNIYIKKQSEILGINTYIVLDDKLGFWNKSMQYINEIKKQLELEEFNNMKLLLNQMNDIILENYKNNKVLLISTYNFKYHEIGLLLWIYFFNINANIHFDTCIKLLSLKIIGNIQLSNETKKFLSYLHLHKT